MRRKLVWIEHACSRIYGIKARASDAAVFDYDSVQPIREIDLRKRVQVSLQPSPDHAMWAGQRQLLEGHLARHVGFKTVDVHLDYRK